MSRHLWNVNRDLPAEPPSGELPVPRLASETDWTLPEETTVELPRYQEEGRYPQEQQHPEEDASQPALSMLSRGRHGIR